MNANPLDLDAIRARADKATPGPWFPVVNDLVGGWSCSTVNAPASHGPAPTPADFCSLDDADFIAHAREDIPALLAKNEQLREALTQLARDDINWRDVDADGQYRGHISSPSAMRELARAVLAAQESAE